MDDGGLRALSALCRLRRIETDEARGHLAEMLAHEAAVTARDDAALWAIQQTRTSAAPFDQDNMAAFLRGMMEEHARLAAALRQADVHIATARQELARRRVAETAARETFARLTAAREALRAGREQVILEDAAQASRRARDR